MRFVISMGSPIRFHTISKKGIHSGFIIGNDFIKGQVPQLVVSGKHWFAAEVIHKDVYALV